MPRHHGLVARAVRLVAVLAVAAAAALAGVLLVGGHRTGTSTVGPLQVLGDLAVKVVPTQGGCNTTFNFLATGSVSGVGRLVYRWEQSDGRATPELSVDIDRSIGSFALHQAWRLEGAQQIQGSMTFRVLQPAPRASTAGMVYSCS